MHDEGGGFVAWVSYFTGKVRCVPFCVAGFSVVKDLVGGGGSSVEVWWAVGVAGPFGVGGSVAAFHFGELVVGVPTEAYSSAPDLPSYAGVVVGEGSSAGDDFGGWDCSGASVWCGVDALGACDLASGGVEFVASVLVAVVVEVLYEVLSAQGYAFHAAGDECAECGWEVDGS